MRSLPRNAALFAVLPLAVVPALVGGSARAAAGAMPVTTDVVPMVHLDTTIQGPFLTDDGALAYNVHVYNAGPDEATGIDVTATPLECHDVHTPIVDCTPLTPTSYHIASLPKGYEDSFLVEVDPPSDGAQVIRTTVQVEHVDQIDTAGIEGTCDDGLDPAQDCATNTDNMTY
jgi:hypothetical protein